MGKLNIFLRFPEADDEVLEFVGNTSLCKELSRSIGLVKSYLREHRHGYCLLYDSRNVAEFRNKAQILDSGVYLSNVLSTLRSFIGTCSRDIAEGTFHDPALTYAVWDCCSCTASVCLDNIIKAAAERSVSSGEDTMLWLLTKENRYGRDILPVVIDALHKRPVLSIIQLNETYKDCIHWIHAIERRITFSLRDMSVFERTNKIYPTSKQRIYKKTDDDTYWYYDFFHRSNSEHYEVFDKCGVHIGEADMSGTIDSKKKDSRKTISDLI